ncbi:MAG: hypothetical protein P4L43_12290 [Syntrophobacteraceae bacterium]|nr:hypothetical protein [Syntrophobacteraceae bacterium]
MIERGLEVVGFDSRNEIEGRRVRVRVRRQDLRLRRLYEGGRVEVGGHVILHDGRLRDAGYALQNGRGPSSAVLARRTVVEIGRGVGRQGEQNRSKRRSLDRTGDKIVIEPLHVVDRRGGRGGERRLRRRIGGAVYIDIGIDHAGGHAVACRGDFRGGSQVDVASDIE